MSRIITARTADGKRSEVGGWPGLERIREAPVGSALSLPGLPFGPAPATPMMNSGEPIKST
ncbi:MAG TPA: hypothetical protein VFG20_20555 [Planctomycetaceae bacterium]|nr:hypothetical protein [Planctomycetaceae bacterium]